MGLTRCTSLPSGVNCDLSQCWDLILLKKRERGNRFHAILDQSIGDLNKNIFLLYSPEYFFKKKEENSILIVPHSLRLFESFGSYWSLIKSKAFTFVRESVTCFWDEEGSYISSSTFWHPSPWSSSTGIPCAHLLALVNVGLLSVCSLFAGLSGGCNITDLLHGAPGATHPLWMGALLDSGQPLPQPFCSQPSFPRLPVSDTPLNTLIRGAQLLGGAAMNQHGKPSCWL